MATSSKFKTTLQLRHQLSCSGISIEAAAYDGRRHHLLTYDTHALKPHALRLFSLRREIRSTPLFDAENNPPPRPPPPVPAKTSKAPSEREEEDPIASIVLSYVSLVYAHELDVFVCVFSAFHDSANKRKRPDMTGYSVLFLEPASLQKLVVFTGPQTHSLRCACFDEATGRLMLASSVGSRTTNSRQSRGTVCVTRPCIDDERSNVIEVLEISKRSLQRPVTALPIALSGGQDSGLDRVMLCVEKAPHATVWNSDPIEYIAAAHRVSVLFGSGFCVYEDDEDRPVVPESVVLEWRGDAVGSFALARRIVHKGDQITALSASPSGQWLFVGHRSGQLAVWNMIREGNDVSDNPQSSVSSNSAALHHQSAIAAIQQQQGPSTFDFRSRSEDLVLFTTDRSSGMTCHWQFCAPRLDGSSTRLTSLGHLDFHSGDSRRITRVTKKKWGGESWIRSIPLCIAVKMNSYTENLLVIARSDVIHVIKIQTLFQIVQEIPEEEEIFTLRMLTRLGGSSTMVCFSGFNSSHRLQLSTLSPGRFELTRSREYHLFAPTQIRSKVSARVTRLQVSRLEASDAWILCGWSTGVVELFRCDGSSSQRVLLLQDPRLDVDITALAIFDTPEAQLGISDLGQTSNIKPSWVGFLKASSASIGFEATTNSKAPSEIFVFAGAASGAVFGWRTIQRELSGTSGLKLEAFTRLDQPPAHSAHVVDLLPVADEAKKLFSIGADGIIKLWSVPSMQLVQHILATTQTATGTRLGLLCSCGEVLGSGKAIAAGYEDGTMAVWRRPNISDCTEVYVELSVNGQHERRVSNIAEVDSTRFLSASFDMTIVLWSITHDADRVDEIRFFDLGEPVLDCCVIEGVVFAALRTEVCRFLLDESQFYQEQSLVPLSTDRLHEEAFVTPSAVDAEAEQMHPQDAVYVEDDSPPSPNLHSPSAQTEESIISIPSVIASESFATLDSFGTPSPSGFEGSTFGPLEGWKTDPAEDSPVETEVVAVFVRQYIATCGTAGTIAAESLSQFLAMHHLPFIKRSRPDFAIRKYLRDSKLDPKTRLNAAEATSVLLEMQRAAKADRDRDIQRSDLRPKTSGVNREALNRLAQPRKKLLMKKCDKQSSDRVPVVTYNILGEKTVKWVSAAVGSNQEAEPDVDPLSMKRHSYAQLPPGGSARKREPKPSKKRSPIKAEMASPRKLLPDQELIQRMHLSASFRQMWTTGYCWCSTSNIRVQWEKDKDEVDDKEQGSRTCLNCRQRLHVVKLVRKEYTPHFTARAILGIVSDVYEMMMEPAHRLLFKNSGDNSSGVDELTIHAALWKLFQNRFGVQHIVEMKLKQLFVSMCHYVREIDAAAVFGELLALFQRPDADEQVPHKMVALCVTIHGWLYAREMIVNGDPILGSADLNASASSVESAKSTHWQYASLTNALYCAQQVLVYPLVSPGYLQNILLYMEDYSQVTPCKPNNDEQKLKRDETTPSWIEVHRILRLLVGEWKQQTTEFRAVERLLFTEPLLAEQKSSDEEQPLAAILEKLRLVLSCLVFFDHGRNGLAEVADFEAILRRLKYLWPNEHLSEEEAAGAKQYQDSLTFENTILAARKRFGDVDGDGRVCYLDFWAMLYIIGVRTKSLLKFREIPIFCKDYKLEVSLNLRKMLTVYMQRSSALLLPRGFQTAKSSADELSHHQHQRRVGGLYEGMYLVDKPLMVRTLSMQELLSNEPKSKSNGLYIDGSIPSLRQSATTAALDPYSGASHHVEVNATSTRAPVVVGVRSEPKVKSVALLSLTSLPPPGSGSGRAARQISNVFGESNANEADQCRAANQISPATDSYGNTYIQFPNISPRHTRIEVAGSLPTNMRSIVGSVQAIDNEAKAWGQQLLQEHEKEEQERLASHKNHKRRVALAREEATQAATASAALIHRRRVGHGSPPREKHSPSKSQTSEVNVTTSSDKMKSSRSRPEESVVVIPSIEKPTDGSAIHGTAVTEFDTRSGPRVRRKGRPVEQENADMRSEAADDETNSSNLLEKWDNSLHENDSDANPPLVRQTIVIMPQMSLEDSDSSSSAIVQSTLPTLSILPDDFDLLGMKNDVDDEDDDALDENKHEKRSDGHTSDAQDDIDGGLDEFDAPDEPKTEADESAIDRDSKPETRATEGSTEKLPEAQLANADVVSLSTTNLPAESTLKSSLPKTNEVKPSQTTTQFLSPRVERIGFGEGSVNAVEKPAEVLVAAKASEISAVKAVVLTNPEPIKPRPLHVSPAKTLAMTSAIQPPQASPSRIGSEAKTKPTSKPSARELRHRFKFSQQPRFQLSAAAVSNPFRTSQWKPCDGSDSDDTESRGGDSDADDDAYDDSVAVDDMKLRLSQDSIAALNKQFKRKTSSRASGHAAIASKHVMGRSFDLEGCHEENIRLQPTNKVVRLDEDTERALYGGHAKNFLGEGIGFSAETEELMQHKWQEFFGDAEATMFSPLKEAVEQREEAQRRQEELQSRLMKKRLDQQQQDTMRLLRNSTATTSREGDRKGSNRQEANFRARRMTRETCFQVQHEVKIGEVASGELKEDHEAQYFHFDFTSDPTECSILTVKLHVEQGDADLFMSTETKAPCSSDFMWRSVEKCVVPGEPSASDLEGQKIVLFPHDLARVIGNNTIVAFFMSVVSLVPNSVFTLGVMTTGQKSEPSQAIQTVDSLISHFNQLATTYEGQASRRNYLTADSSSSSRISMSATSSVDRLREFLATASSMESAEEELLEAGESDQVGIHRHSTVRRANHEALIHNAAGFNATDAVVQDGDNGSDHEEDASSQGSSFQQLLESIGKRHGHVLRENHSLVLGGPTTAQEEFAEDEEASLRATQERLSPARLQPLAGSVEINTTGDRLSAVDDGASDAIAVVTERRLSVASSFALQQRLGSRVKHQLSPLNPVRTGKKQSGPVSLRVARFEPKLVAYSLSTLPPPKHSHHQSITSTRAVHRQASQQLK